MLSGVCGTKCGLLFCTARLPPQTVSGSGQATAASRKPLEPVTSCQGWAVGRVREYENAEAFLVRERRGI